MASLVPNKSPGKFKRRHCEVIENPLHQLPHDFVIEILEKLPIRSLLRFKAVCKSWRCTIESAQFARQQLQYSRRRSSEAGKKKTGHGQRIFMQGCPSHDLHSLPSFYDVSSTSIRTLELPFKLSEQRHRSIVVHSCDGVLLLVEDPTRVMFLWNPITQKFKQIPNRALRSSSESWCSALLGFGYDSSTQEYRIVRIELECDNFLENQLAIQVFGSKTESWTAVENLTNRYKISPGHANSNAFIHGGIHFMAYDSLERKYVVLCLSLDGEIIREFPVVRFLPEEFPRFNFSAAVQAGRLCLQGIIENVDWVKSRFEVWVMEEYGDSKSWTRILSVLTYTMNFLDLYEPLSTTQNGDVLVIRFGSDVYLYDVKRKKMMDIDVMKTKCCDSSVVKMFPTGVNHHSFWCEISNVQSLLSP